MLLAKNTLMNIPSPYHVYIHAPWCKSKCPYCDFNVYVEQHPPFEKWMRKIFMDWNWTLTQSQWPQDGPCTLYFGGGTPSLVPTELLSTIIQNIRTDRTTEITLEINPGDVTPKRLEELKAIGVTRLSLGIQTFNRHHLRRLGRGTTPKDCLQLLQWVQDAQFNSWSMDLMFGLPHQTLDELNDDIEQMLGLHPPHVSLYGLTYKEGTPFHRQLEHGKIHPIDEDAWVEQFKHISTKLHEAGYTRYEVSNFCKPPHQAKHNEGIWKNEHYMGLGPGAHGFWPNGIRSVYPREWKEWSLNQAPSIEKCTQDQAAIDWLITAIRHHEGIFLPTLQDMGYTLNVPSTIQRSPL